jgi:hypothetical protein
MDKVILMIHRLFRFVLCKKKLRKPSIPISNNVEFNNDVLSKYNLQLSENEWKIIRDCIEQKALELLNHEKKNYAKTGFDPSRYYQVILEDRTFFIISTRVFYYIIEEVLIEACEKFPDSFGRHRTDTILNAIYNVEKVGALADFPEFLRTEQFAWIVELLPKNINQKILRVDLFRHIRPNNFGGTDFTGGIFHAFKHFSFKGIPLSTHPEINDLSKPKDIFNYLIRAFYFEQFKSEGNNKFSALVTLNSKYNLLFYFYFEQITKVYFIVSIRKEKKKLP